MGRLTAPELLFAAHEQIPMAPQRDATATP